MGRLSAQRRQAVIALLEEVQEEGLRLGDERLDLVEEKRSTLRFEEFSRPFALGTGVRRRPLINSCRKWLTWNCCGNTSTGIPTRRLPCW